MTIAKVEVASLLSGRTSLNEEDLLGLALGLVPVEEKLASLGFSVVSADAMVESIQEVMNLENAPGMFLAIGFLRTFRTPPETTVLVRGAAARLGQRRSTGEPISGAA